MHRLRLNSINPNRIAAHFCGTRPNKTRLNDWRPSINVRPLPAVLTVIFTCALICSLIVLFKGYKRVTLPLKNTSNFYFFKFLRFAQILYCFLCNFVISYHLLHQHAVLLFFSLQTEYFCDILFSVNNYIQPYCNKRPDKREMPFMLFVFRNCSHYPAARKTAACIISRFSDKLKAITNEKRKKHDLREDFQRSTEKF